ncbi:hypothetical protein HRbin36_02142 [bacterium HR36]|uniref:Hypothetical conserved protein n=1 Tax=uncultured Planctomycetota bacterium TaxID=120965 RepID=H5SCP7_9BACT|nr:hypothetical conserved protein [uncultured Planctomycetota bacterium]GBD37012.1 hypothetical protein HRbin36_02142 [bacterium HR36]
MLGREKTCWPKLTWAVMFGLIGTVMPAWAGKVRFFQHQQPAHYEKAERRTTVVVSDGSIRLGRQIEHVAKLDAANIWCIVEDGQGRLVVGTGNEGKIWRIDPEGRAQLVHKAEDPQIFSLLATPDGRLIAGTGPSGLLLEIPPAGSPRTLAKTGESYVWSLAYDPTTDTLYAGTGPHGKILRISRTGQVELLYATKQEHVQALLWSNGQLYAATARRGLVYRLDTRTKHATVLFESPHNDVRALCVVDEVVFAGTAVPLNKIAPSPATSTSGVSSIKENVLYAIQANGTVQEVFRDRAMILAITSLDRDRLLLATASQGQLFELDWRQRLSSELVRLENPQVTAVCRRRDGSIALGSGEPARVSVLRPQYAAQGTLVSEVLDAKQVSRFCRVSWAATLPKGTRLSVALRTGNTTVPDSTWTPWSAEITEPDQLLPSLPSGRFVQYRLTLATETPQHSPVLQRLSLGYQHVNLAPEITSLEVPDIESQSADTAKTEGARKLRFKWSASDPNEDTLVFDVYFRKEGWQHWVELARDLEKSELEWDASTVPSGTYRLKVIASDRKENAESESRQTERVSPPFIVDNQPPQVTLRLDKWEGETAVVEVQATDNLTRISQASWSLDGGKWQNLFPTDGIFDSRAKTFRLRVGPLKPGTHVIVVRVSDAVGNVGAADLVFEK